MTQIGHSHKGTIFLSEIKNIEWRRLGIEATAIVLSILLAFWIDAWWERRKELASHVAQLRSFEQELLENAEQLDRHVQETQGYISALDEALRELGKAEALSKSVNKNIGNALFFHTDPIATSVYNEILNSGTLQRIQSSELKTAIGKYEREIERVSDHMDESWAVTRSILIPFLISHVPFDELGWIQTYEMRFGASREITATAPASPPSMKLREISSSDAWNTLYYWRVMQVDNIRARTNARRSIDEVLLHLRVELEESID